MKTTAARAYIRPKVNVHIDFPRHKDHLLASKFIAAKNLAGRRKINGS
ncbi:hypothetical protein AIOL_003183 [Candidatus Rhodobacter oscarellae]|uniref:Uncharacterized protein n=1 Tax=Candidatus Rhodobacter oscarellae TaxID=1675527 RepID=A0A0J9E6A2_9RHOB|nr:hypothetical protein [Candidatus Rhodobacter lobularis]KMW58212.1 hypothetical protein AIOL_003183 [Candidatus Rhodobacter lobularis]